MINCANGEDLGELGNLPMQGRSKVEARSRQGCWARSGQGCWARSGQKTRLGQARLRQGRGKVAEQGRCKNQGWGEARLRQGRSKAGASRIEPKSPRLLRPCLNLACPNIAPTLPSVFT